MRREDLYTAPLTREVNSEPFTDEEIETLTLTLEERIGVSRQFDFFRDMGGANLKRLIVCNDQLKIVNKEIFFTHKVTSGSLDTYSAYHNMLQQKYAGYLSEQFEIKKEMFLILDLINTKTGGE